ncbi:MAG: hypothetical protein MHMPM18_003575, partial [Marteilia pararefringens]
RMKTNFLFALPLVLLYSIAKTSCDECDTNAILPDIRDELASQCKPTCKKIMTDVEFSDDRQTITPINSTYTVDNLSPDSEECAAHLIAVAMINANAYLQGTPINFDSDNIDYACESVCQFGYVAACDPLCVGIVDIGGDNTGDEGPKKLSSFVAIGLPLIFGLSFAICCIGFACFLALKKPRRSEMTNRAVEQAQET